MVSSVFSVGFKLSVPSAAVIGNWTRCFCLCRSGVLPNLKKDLLQLLWRLGESIGNVLRVNAAKFTVYIFHLKFLLDFFFKIFNYSKHQFFFIRQELEKKKKVSKQT